jgi:hypothetical protein
MVTAENDLTTATENKITTVNLNDEMITTVVDHEIITAAGNLIGAPVDLDNKLINNLNNGTSITGI